MFIGRCNLTVDLVVCHGWPGLDLIDVTKGWVAFRNGVAWGLEGVG